MQNLPGSTYAFYTPGSLPRRFVEGYKPLCDAEGARDFALVVGDEDARWGRVGREHDPVFFAKDDGIPGGGCVWVLEHHNMSTLHIDNS